MCGGAVLTGVPLGRSRCGGVAGPQWPATTWPLLWCDAGGQWSAGPRSPCPAGRLQPVLPRYVHSGHEGGTPGRGTVPGTMHVVLRQEIHVSWMKCTIIIQPLFWPLVSSSHLQVELVGMSYIGLKAVVDFLYSGELPLDGGNIDHVLEAAHLLQVTDSSGSFHIV